MSNILGVSAGFHDAAISLISPDGDIIFAGHAERYSKKKNDSDINMSLLAEVHPWDFGTIAYYERPWNKQLRQIYSGQGLEWNKLTTRQILAQQIGNALPEGMAKSKIINYNHHLSHAAAGFQTSPYDRATVVVIDAIGEWDTISIWGAKYDDAGRAVYKRLWRQRYPHSIGLFYSAMTQRVGLKPSEEEYIMMGMSAYGRSASCDVRIEQGLGINYNNSEFAQNLHLGIDLEFLSEYSPEDISAGAQQVLEKLVYDVMLRAKLHNWSRNLVYMGGVALNCLANRNLGDYFDNIWIMPNPGDAGSSLGAAALAYGKKITWHNAYLGHDIPGDYPVDDILHHLLHDKIVGVASGRAEFGPRALGNRSLLADPRGPEIKDQVNAIKRRQKFRPFAPVILEEHAHRYFAMPVGWSDSRYMQLVGHCRRPDLYPAIVHVDHTSRIQTVPADGSGIRKLLEAWYNKTGCPMLLNTSLNIRGEPMVNDRADADRFEKMYNVKVCS
jgi:carbamoyltransferase